MVESEIKELYVSRCIIIRFTSLGVLKSGMNWVCGGRAHSRHLLKIRCIIGRLCLTKRVPMEINGMGMKHGIAPSFDLTWRVKGVCWRLGSWESDIRDTGRHEHFSQDGILRNGEDMYGFLSSWCWICQIHVWDHAWRVKYESNRVFRLTVRHIDLFNTLSPRIECLPDNRPPKIDLYPCDFSWVYSSRVFHYPIVLFLLVSSNLHRRRKSTTRFWRSVVDPWVYTSISIKVNPLILKAIIVH